ncbi:AAA domain-containing protein [Myxococcota bacterium]|nr:AAA domain-containing protein [Myxococcota bacterium]
MKRPAVKDAKAAIDAHLRELVELVALESRAEAEATRLRAAKLTAAEAEASGDALVELTVEDERFGLGGRLLVKLVKPRAQHLPWTRLGVGAPVVLSPSIERVRDVYCAVVSARDERSIELALADDVEELEDHERWRVDLTSDEITARRQRDALERVRGVKDGRLAELRAILLGDETPDVDPDGGARTNISKNVDVSQGEAVSFALASRDVALIHGPPGTGKTSTVCALIREAVARGEKVLATAPSNLATDNILERLVAAGVRVVRLGHPARVMPGLAEHTLDLLVESHEDVRLARKLVREAVALRRKAEKWTRAKPEPGARAELRREARALITDARRLEDQAVERVLDGADVVCATTSLDARILGRRTFDLVVVDEACQSTEPGAWIPLCFASGRVVLAGDHLQLSPTITSREAAERGLGTSLFERVLERWGDRVVRVLTTQYRMHELIMSFPSDTLYGGVLVADGSVARHVLADLPGVARTPLTEEPVELFDTAGAGWDEALEPDGESRENPDEARLVITRIQALRAAGVPASVIAVITPYAAQVRHLERALAALDLGGVEVDTVDGFQGREKEVVIISCVRSNPDGEIGFLADVRRMNVALTRARRKLVIIGDGATLGGHPFYASLWAWAEAKGVYHTVWEL